MVLVVFHTHGSWFIFVPLLSYWQLLTMEACDYLKQNALFLNTTSRHHVDFNSPMILIPQIIPFCFLDPNLYSQKLGYSDWPRLGCRMYVSCNGCHCIPNPPWGKSLREQEAAARKRGVEGSKNPVMRRNLLGDPNFRWKKKSQGKIFV